MANCTIIVVMSRARAKGHYSVPGSLPSLPQTRGEDPNCIARGRGANPDVHTHRGPGPGLLLNVVVLDAL